jgi:phage N-6-adenine-methyltransferase
MIQSDMINIDVKISDLVVEPHRSVSDETVASLAKSIEQIGLLHPIVVGSDRKVLAGTHRVRAFERLGRNRIPACIVELKGLDAELATIDENLIRNEGTELERDRALARRREIYEILNPQARHGGPRASGQNGHLKTPSFAEDAAQKTGESERSVRRRTKIGKDLVPAVDQVISGTSIADSVSQLEQLAQVPPEDQVDVAEEAVKTGKVRQPHKAMNVPPKEGDDKNVRFTPRKMIAALHERFRFTIDVASDPASPAAEIIGRHWTEKDDALEQSWDGERVWCNPPYDNVTAWVQKANQSVINENCRLVVMLIPANRTDQPFWQRFIEPWRDRPKAHVWTQFVEGRVRFGSLEDPEGERAGSPLFPCVLVIWTKVSQDPREVSGSSEDPKIPEGSTRFDAGNLCGVYSGSGKSAVACVLVNDHDGPHNSGDRTWPNKAAKRKAAPAISYPSPEEIERILIKAGGYKEQVEVLREKKKYKLNVEVKSEPPAKILGKRLVCEACGSADALTHHLNITHRGSAGGEAGFGYALTLCAKHTTVVSAARAMQKRKTRR